VVRFALRPLYPIMYICTSWIAVSRHPAIFETSSVCFLAKQLTHFLLKRLAWDAYSSHRSLTSHISLCSLNHSAKRCCYRKSLPEGVLHIRIFVVCIPLALQQNVSFSDIIYSSWWLAKTQTHFISNVAEYITAKRD